MWDEMLDELDPEAAPLIDMAFNLMSIPIAEDDSLQ